MSDGHDGLRSLMFEVNTSFHSRVSFLLVTESIFLAGFVNLIKGGPRDVLTIVGVLGIIMTVILWIPNYQLAKRSKVIAARLSEVDADYKAYLRAASLMPVSVTKLLANVLPLVFVIAWITLLAYAS